MNQHTIFGRLGKEPELKGEGDKAYMFLTVATDDYVGKGKGKEKDGKKSDYDTTWHDVTVFAERAKYVSDKFKKGDFILLVGSVMKRKRKEGDGYDTKTVVGFTGSVAGPYRSAAEAAAANGSASKAAPAQQQAQIQDEDIPF